MLFNTVSLDAHLESRPILFFSFHYIEFLVELDTQHAILKDDGDYKTNQYLILSLP
jgi:hypothetical protein